MMTGQWIFGADKTALYAAFVAVAALLSLSACVDDEQAVDMGLATKCESGGTVERLGDPAGRFVTLVEREVCRGPKRDAYTEQTLLVGDCQSGTQYAIGMLRQSADPARRGPDFDAIDAVNREKLRLKVGLTDISTLTSGLQAAGITVKTQPQAGAAMCEKLAAAAAN
jgi:hypothetical protein